MDKKVNINFHQTFKPEKQYISSILDIAGMMQSMSVQDISANTGIPNGQSSGKVEPHINYAKYMGLIDVIKKDGLYNLSRTALGELVFLEDPGFQENLSILLCHAMMLRKENGASMWSVTFNEVLPKYRLGIKKDLLLKELSQMYDGKINKKNFAPFVGSYEEMFSSINILSIDTENIVTKTLPYNKEYIFLYAYILFEYWDEIFPEYEEISSSKLKNIGFDKPFGWDEETEYKVLEHLADKGIIRLNKQLTPYTILRLIDKQTVMENLYSELC